MLNRSIKEPGIYIYSLNCAVFTRVSSLGAYIPTAEYISITIRSIQSDTLCRTISPLLVLVILSTPKNNTWLVVRLWTLIAARSATVVYPRPLGTAEYEALAVHLAIHKCFAPPHAHSGNANGISVLACICSVFWKHHSQLIGALGWRHDPWRPGNSNEWHDPELDALIKGQSLLWLGTINAESCWSLRFVRGMSQATDMINNMSNPEPPSRILFLPSTSASSHICSAHKQHAFEHSQHPLRNPSLRGSILGRRMEG